MATVVDRRHESNGKRFFSSRQRFINRNKKKIKKAMDQAISNGSIESIGKGGIDITIPRDDVHEPKIHHGQGGINRQVRPGNKQFSQGDVFEKPPGGGGGSGGDQPGEPGDPSDSGEGQDEFVFTMSEEEFLNYLFQDMELPNLKKKTVADITQTEPKRAGFVSDGAPSKLDLGKSKAKQIARNVALKKPKNREIFNALKEQYSMLSAYTPDYESDIVEKYLQSFKGRRLSDSIDTLAVKVDELYSTYEDALSEEDAARFDELNNSIEETEHKKSLVPKWHDMDLTYRHHERVPTPTTQAAMFCLMDVSGSMDEHKKANAKLFYMLLYRFLKRNYQKVDIVFIRHTTEAEEVDEETFFYDRETGGTKVSSALAEMQDIINERYPVSDWNIYGAQASDGENWGGDNEICLEILDDLMNKVQAFFYTEVKYPGQNHVFGEALWEAYASHAEKHEDQFFMGKINEKKDIWPVFREFFQKREEYENGPRQSTSRAAMTAALMSPLRPAPI